MRNLTIGFIGLGNMGGPMATNLAAAGHTVRGNDVAGTTAEGVAEAKTIAEAVGDADVVITMLPNGAILRQVAEEAVAHMAAGALLIDCSTVDVESARFAAEARASGRSIDAPRSRGLQTRRQSRLYTRRRRIDFLLHTTLSHTVVAAAAGIVIESTRL